MIPERVQDGINIMKRAQNLNMDDWQRQPEDDIDYDKGVGNKPARSESDLHNCGNSACFAGYVAVSQEFHAAGGYCGPGGAPHYREPRTRNGLFTEWLAIKHWLGITDAAAKLIVFGHKDTFVAPYYSPFYGKCMSDVTPENVIEKLELLLNGGFSEKHLTRAHYLRAANRWYHDCGDFEIIQDESKVRRVDSGATVAVRVCREGKQHESTIFIWKREAIQEITDFA